MHLFTHHLELIFLASTVTPSVGTGWVYTTTPAPQPLPRRAPLLPVPVRFAVVD